MLNGSVIVFTSFAYLGLLFAIAYFADQRADAGKPVIANPYIYSLSLAVYATAWTFYGSVGRAAGSGIDFLPIYLGPILVFALGHPLLLRIVRLAKAQNITSVADFVAARYGKSEQLAALGLEDGHVLHLVTRAPEVAARAHPAVHPALLLQTIPRYAAAIRAKTAAAIPSRPALSQAPHHPPQLPPATIPRRQDRRGRRLCRRRVDRPLSRSRGSQLPNKHQRACRWRHRHRRF